MQNRLTPLNTLPIIFKISGLIIISLSITHCASAKENFSALKAKTNTDIYQNRDFGNLNMRLNSDLIQSDFQGKLRTTLDGSGFSTNIWNSSCDC